MTQFRSSSKARLEWKRRAKVTMADVSRRRTWESLCGRYRVWSTRPAFWPKEGPVGHFRSPRPRRSRKGRNDGSIASPAA